MKKTLIAAAVSLTIPSFTYANMLEEVVVTAQKRAQNIQNVGLSIAAFTGDQMEALGWKNSLDVAAQTPGVVATPNTGDPGNLALFSIRGVSQTDFAEGQEAPIAVYRDEVYISSPGTSGVPTYDIDRIEVLRGPQGTLYGRNSTGGLVHFISKRPTEEFEGGINLTFGEYGQQGVSGVLSGSLTDTTQGRLAVYSNKDDGYMENRVGKNGRADDTLSSRGMLNFDINESSSLLLIGQHTEIDATGGVFHTVASSGPNTAIADRRFCTTAPEDEACRYSSYGIFGFDDTVDDGQVNFGSDFEGDPDRLAGIDDGDGDVFAGAYDFDGGVDRSSSSMTAIYEKSFESGIRLTSVSDYTTSEKDYREDTDNTNSTYLNDGVTQHATYEAGADIDQLSQELRLTGEDDAMRWIAGLYYLDIENSYYGSFKFAAFGSPFLPRFDAKNTTETFSVFGQVDYVLSDSLTLTAGARWIRDDKELDLQFTEDAVSGSGFLNDGTKHTISRTDNEWSGKIQLDWQSTDTTLIYAGINRGVKGGGFNTDTYGVAPPTLEAIGYDPEVLTAYEIGAKTEFGNLRLNGSVYFYDYSDYQAFFFQGITSLLINSEAESLGAELEAIYSTDNGWDMLFGISLQDTEVNNKEYGVVDQNAPLAPEVSLNGMIRKTWSLSRGDLLSVTVSANYLDDRSFNTIQSEITTGDSYTLVNAGIQYVSNNERWEVGFNVNNLTDQEAQTYGYDIAGFTQQVFAPPRWASANIKFNF